MHNATQRRSLNSRCPVAEFVLVCGLAVTYQEDGRQYIALAISDRTHSGEYIAFRLPS